LERVRPSFIDPTPARAQLPDGGAWIYEAKLDSPFEG